jgi:poly-beta-hydroxybutyrate-responsive repressor
MQGGRRGGGRGGRGRGRRRRIRGFLEPCLLLILERGRSHGYDLTAALEPFGLEYVHPSLVYRSLRDMENEGFVESEWDTEGSAGPARRVYAVTEAGHRRLDEWVSDLRETDRVLHTFLEAVDRTRNVSESE